MDGILSAVHARLTTNMNESYHNMKKDAMTYHLGVQERVVEIWIGFEQLTSQVACILDVLEQGYVNWKGLIVRKGEGPY